MNCGRTAPGFSLPTEDLIGVSTISFGGIQAEEAIDAVAAGGFRTIEMLLGVDRMAAIGHPSPLPASCWLFPDNVDRSARQRLRAKLSGFACVTAHVQIADVNIASINPRIRAESVRQYVDCIELARDLNIPLITFHCGRLTRAGYPGVGAAESLGYNRQFAELALDLAQKYDMHMGYECLGPECLDLIAMVKAAGGHRFGVHIDLMWTTRAVGREGLLKAIEESRGHIVEVHVHGGLHRAMEVAGHLPVRMNNVVDFATALPRIRDTGFRGPFIFEITSSEDAATVIRDCQDSKRLVLDYLRNMTAG